MLKIVKKTILNWNSHVDVQSAEKYVVCKTDIIDKQCIEIYI